MNVDEGKQVQFLDPRSFHDNDQLKRFFGQQLVSESLLENFCFRIFNKDAVMNDLRVECNAAGWFERKFLFNVALEQFLSGFGIRFVFPVDSYFNSLLFVCLISK